MGKENILAKCRAVFVPRRGKYERKRDRTMLKARLSAITAALVLAGSIFIWGTVDGSMAWFANNRQVTAGGLQVKADLPEGVTATITVHHPVGEVTDTENGTRMAYDKTPGAFDMPLFDLLEPLERSVLLKIELSEAVPGLELSVKTATDYFMDATEHKLLDSPDGKGEGYQNCMTSIVQFACYETAGTVYVGSRECYPIQLADAQYKDFVTQEDDTYKVEGGSIDLGKFEGNNTTLYVLIIYNETLINHIYMSNTGNPALSGANAIRFVMDFNFELTK